MDPTIAETLLNEYNVGPETYERYQELVKKRMAKQNFEFLAKTLMNKHPALVKMIDVVEVIRLAEKRVTKQLKAAEVDGVLALELWENMRKTLDTDESCRSYRIDRIVDIFQQHMASDRPGNGFLIIDEHLCFLDIVEIALRNSGVEPEIFRYDGRSAMEKRWAIVDKFSKAEGTRVLLMTQANTEGLKIPNANVVIQCFPSPVNHWEQRAKGLVYHLGQTQPSFYHKLMDSTSEHEQHVERLRREDQLRNSG